MSNDPNAITVIANDLSAEQIALAPSIPRIEWRVAAAHEMLHPAGGIDAAIAASALHWFDPREKIAEQIATLWGPGGLPVSMPLTIRAGRRPLEPTR